MVEKSPFGEASAAAGRPDVFDEAAHGQPSACPMRLPRLGIDSLLRCVVVTGTSDVFTTFAVAVIGGVVAPQVTQARERRSARATAAERLGGVEMARWWPATYPEYRERLILFRAAAVGANLPKPVLDEYVRLSRVARLASFSAGEAAKDRGESPWSGRIDPRLHDLLEEAVELVLMCLWHPWRSLPRYRRRLR